MDPIIIPDEYKNSFQRLIPYFPVAMRDDPQAIESVLIFLKVGGEKLARIAIEAFKQNQRLNQAEAQKRMREQALAIDLAAQADHEDEDSAEEEADDDETIGNEDEF